MSSGAWLFLVLAMAKELRHRLVSLFLGADGESPAGGLVGPGVGVFSVSLEQRGGVPAAAGAGVFPARVVRAGADAAEGAGTVGAVAALSRNLKILSPGDNAAIIILAIVGSAMASSRAMVARMGKHFDSLDDGDLRDFLLRQHLFFVATAPTGADGHINLSPKGLDGLRVLGPLQVAYLDYPGSGVETIAHLRDNGRIVLMFCAMAGPPRIVRLHGRGRVVMPGDGEFAALLQRFTPEAPPRSIIVVDLTRISDSCGYGVPRYEYMGERDQLRKWAERKGAEGLLSYQREKNARSIDGLPGLWGLTP